MVKGNRIRWSRMTTTRPKTRLEKDLAVTEPASTAANKITIWARVPAGTARQPTVPLYWLAARRRQPVTTSQTEADRAGPVGPGRIDGGRGGYGCGGMGLHTAGRRPIMGIGVSLFLLVVGAILTFALDLRVSGVDIDVVGWILMAGGTIGLIATLIMWSGRRGQIATTEPTAYRRVEERRDVGPYDPL
jgi:hypothetical protein